MIEKLFGNSVTLVTCKSEDSIKGLRNAVMSKHAQMTFLEDAMAKYIFPQKFTLIYNWNLMTCCMVKVEEEFSV